MEAFTQPETQEESKETELEMKTASTTPASTTSESFRAPTILPSEAVPSEADANLSKLLEKLLNSQSSAGFWNKRSDIVSFFEQDDLKGAEELQAEVKELIKDKKLFE